MVEIPTVIKVAMHYGKHALAEVSGEPVKTRGGEVEEYGPVDQCDICAAVDFGASYPGEAQRLQVIDSIFRELERRAKEIDHAGG